MTDKKTDATTALVEGSMAVAEVGLGILRTEMELLRAVLPGAPVVHEDEPTRLRHEADVEDGFDNMPV